MEEVIAGHWIVKLDDHGKVISVHADEEIVPRLGDENLHRFVLARVNADRAARVAPDDVTTWGDEYLPLAWQAVESHH
jgi:hypothetical protein